MADDDEEGYGLVMPFVATKSHGGNYDDGAFVAGWSSAVVDETLRTLATLRANGLASATVKRHVYAGMVQQLDLVAMRHGFTLTTEDAEHGWTLATFTLNP